MRANRVFSDSDTNSHHLESNATHLTNAAPRLAHRGGKPTLTFRARHSFDETLCPLELRLKRTKQAERLVMTNRESRDQREKRAPFSFWENLVARFGVEREGLSATIFAHARGDARMFRISGKTVLLRQQMHLAATVSIKVKPILMPLLSSHALIQRPYLYLNTRLA